MPMTHLHPDLLRMVLAGELPPKAVLRLLLDHLRELCPECSAALDAARTAHPELAPLEADGEEEPQEIRTQERDGGISFATPSAATTASPYAVAFERAAEAVHRQRDAVAAERERAARDAAELLALPPAERRMRVEAEVGERFRGRLLAEKLLEACLETVRRDATEALDLAELAAVVVRRSGAPEGELEPPAWAHELSLLCLAHAANALRVRGHLPAADLMVRRLHRRREEHRVADPLVEAELASLEASLRLDQRRLPEAAELLQRASRAYREGGSAQGRAKVDLQRAAVLRQQGDAEGAAALLGRLTAAGSPLPAALRRLAVNNRALALCDLERPAEARELLRRHEELFAGGSEWDTLRLRWLEGRIALGLEELDEAAAALDEARRGFLEREEGFSAALVSLDLAAVHATAGDTAAVRELAAGLEPVFATRDVDRETVATLVLFQQAAAAERAERDLILHLRQLLERGRGGRRTPVRPS